MAKKKKIANNRGYATTSIPSKKIVTPLSTPDSPSSLSPPPTTQAPIPPASPCSPQEQPDDVARLVQRFKSLNPHKVDTTMDRLLHSRPMITLMKDLNINPPSLSFSSPLEQDILNVIKQLDALDIFSSPSLRRRASQTDKDRVIGHLDVIYLTLTKLGFDPIDIEASLKVTTTTDIDHHLDWLCLNVPYDRLPVGFADTYFSDQGVQIKLQQSKINKKEDTLEETRKLEELVLLDSKSSSEPTTAQDDYKLRVLQAAQDYLDDDEEEKEDINLQHARKKLELTELESQVRESSGMQKKKKFKSKTLVTLSDQELDQIKQEIENLKRTLQTMEQDWDYDKRKSHELFIEQQKILADQRRQQIKQDQAAATENMNDTPSEQNKDEFISSNTDAINSNTNNSVPVNDDDDGDDDDDMFGGFMDMMEQEATTTSTSSTSSPTIEWQIVDLSLPNSWKGRTPKQLLEEYCKSYGFVKCNYSKINKGASIWQASVSMSKRSLSDAPMIVHLPEKLATTKPVDAEQLVAAAALFQLDPQSSTYQIMATPFKNLWLEWKKEKMDKDEAPRIEADRKRVQFLMDRLNDSFSQSPKKSQPRILSNTTESPVDEFDWAQDNNNKSLKRKQIFEDVQQRFSKRLTTPAYLQMKAKRKDLPIADYREEILKMIQSHQVVIISGETGCGKSTQVPQYLAEHLLIPGSHSGSVICTQPRRISAMSIAQRVSKEMGDRPKTIGSKEAMVGYQIRLENKVSDENVLVFCTTGILLRRLESDPWLNGISHVVVDEVHERTIDSDFLLVVLQRLCHNRPDLRVILMSATVNANRFSAYFGNCPVVSVPGRTFPVHVQYLEDIVETTGYVLEEDSHYAIKKSRIQTNQGNIHVSGRHGSSKTIHYEIFDEDSDADDSYIMPNPSKLSIVQADENQNDEDETCSQQYSRQTLKMVKRMDENKINYDLIVNLLEHIYQQSNSNQDETIPRSGAILIFLPGMPEIRKLYDLISMHSILGDEKRTLLIALHSTLSSEQQERAFDLPPHGIRKIVLATNIAETGITISDVTIVIDTGMAKIINHDQEKRITRLQQMYVAKANVNQRKGRAGRVQEGLCYHLFTQDRYNKMADYETPEILRLPLEELCLRIKVCHLGSIEEVLETALDAPSKKMVKNAIQTLQEVQALSNDEFETLTPLGTHLANLPVDVHIGKMILFGAIFRCLDPILTIAAALSFKSPFVRPFGDEDEADKAREQFKQDESDFLTIYRAYCAWRDEFKRVRQGSGWRRKIYEFCKKHYLSQKNLETIEDMKKQYLELLISIGFVKVAEEDINQLKRYDMLNRTSFLCHIPPIYNQYSHSTNMINASITAGLYPKIALYNPNTHAFIKQDMTNMTIHPSSTLCKQQLSTEFLVYNTVVMNNDKVYMWETCSIDPIAVILLANDMDIMHCQKMVVVDQWIQFQCYARTATLIKFLRHEMKKWLQDKMDDPGLDLTNASATIMELIVKILEARNVSLDR
ncbi:P-loop containing nucleoside triphosphate hydrolase protein [Halteromyces radiatus]|uniref:P-loop containing nucleoside triphosphate hydrolase protein n=1 Tax=Halteromyces radiatus TaxID=101107 RepID=UPI00221E382A|nr:P-loop containing nucleoside triphosphate hydrolase protein [Halteromyces radiatus]KAI8089248.1 P-loop containing nucleoside triphosphate hydrolase protein [Halteromyces radiatus]